MSSTEMGPARTLAGLRRRRTEAPGTADRVWESVARPFSWRQKSQVMQARWVPAMDVARIDNQIVVVVELPGMTGEDFEVIVGDHDLTLKGEKGRSLNAGPIEYYRTERTYGRFLRQMALPPEADTAGAQATFKNGLLRVQVPLKEKAVPETPRVVLRACPNCRGDLFLEEADEYVCLQCGRRGPLREMTADGNRTAEEVGPASRLAG